MMGASSSAMHARSKATRPGTGSQVTLTSKTQGEENVNGIVETSTTSKMNQDKQGSTYDVSTKDFDDVLKKINLAEHDLKSAKNIMKKNEDIPQMFLHSVKAVVSLMKGNDDDTCLYVGKMNQDFFAVPMEKRAAMGEFLQVVNFPLASYQRYKQVLKKLGQDKIDEDILLKADETSQQIIWLVRGHWWNYSDCSTTFGSSLVTHDIVQEMVQDIENLIDVDEKTIKFSFTFESAIGVLHNVGKVESHRQTFRDLKLVAILGNFLKYEKAPKITMLVLLTLALIIDENQTDLLFSHESSFDLLIRLANRAWKAKDHRYDGFSVDELVLGLKGLSKNDKVKRLLVDKGILTLVCNILVDGNAEEKDIAAKLLWELSFDTQNKTLIKENETLMSTLREISSSSGKIAKSAQGVLWVLDMESLKRNMESLREKMEMKIQKKLKKRATTRSEIADEGVADSSPNIQGHIMISYNWDDQKRLIQVKEALKQQGFSVWMDIDNLSGSTLQAMAEAVEGSSVVLVCMSERYKESANCRSEAEYAFSLKKPIVPLLMQERYKPDGWLGILLGTKLFFDFSGRFSFDAKLSELEKELAGRGISNTPSDVVDGPIVKETAPLVGKVPAKFKSTNQTMKDVDVKAWVLENKLDKFPLFNSMESTHLSFLKKLSVKAPEFYYSFLLDMKQEKKTLEDLNYIMQVTDAIGELPF